MGQTTRLFITEACSLASVLHDSKITINQIKCLNNSKLYRLNNGVIYEPDKDKLELYASMISEEIKIPMKFILGKPINIEFKPTTNGFITKY